MILTDTHTHLYSEAFDEDRDAVIAAAISSGVERFFIPAIDASYTASMHALAEKYPKRMFLMSGVHPTHVKENILEELAHVTEQLKQGGYVAVGEIGVDLYWDKTFKNAQMDAFRYQIQLAKEYQLPIVIHCRDAFNEVFEVLEEHKGTDLRGIFHCFTGNLEQAKQAIGYNMKLGIGGVVTFKNGKIDQFLNEIPLTEIVLETDAPYLAPTPFRGKRNESAHLYNIAEKVADIYGVSVEKIAEITTENSKHIFGV